MKERIEEEIANIQSLIDKDIDDLRNGKIEDVESTIMIINANRELIKKYKITLEHIKEYERGLL